MKIGEGELTVTKEKNFYIVRDRHNEIIYRETIDAVNGNQYDEIINYLKDFGYSITEVKK